MPDIVSLDGPHNRLPKTCAWPDAPASDRPRFSVKFAREANRLGLIRDLTCGDELVVRSVTWTRTFNSVDDATAAIDVLGSSRDSFLLWSAYTAALGSEWLDPVVDAIVAAAKDRKEAERRRAEDEANAAFIAAAEHKRIRIFFPDKAGQFVVSMERGTSRQAVLWSLAFDEAWERDRFWDWFGWQRDRYEELVGSLQHRDRLDLERQLLREMLSMEQAVKRAGFGSGGRRPLRFWRGETP